MKKFSERRKTESFESSASRKIIQYFANIYFVDDQQLIILSDQSLAKARHSVCFNSTNDSVAKVCLHLIATDQNLETERDILRIVAWLFMTKISAKVAVLSPFVSFFSSLKKPDL